MLKDRFKELGDLLKPKKLTEVKFSGELFRNFRSIYDQFNTGTMALSLETGHPSIGFVR